LQQLAVAQYTEIHLCAAGLYKVYSVCFLLIFLELYNFLFFEFLEDCSSNVLINVYQACITMCRSVLTFSWILWPAWLDTYSYRRWCFCFAASKLSKLSSHTTDQSHDQSSAADTLSQPGSSLHPDSARLGSGHLIRIHSGFDNVQRTIVLDYPDFGRVDTALSRCKIFFVAGKKTVSLSIHNTHMDMYCLHTHMYLYVCIF